MESLLVAIIRNDLETALYETGDLLKDGQTEVLENTWIRALALLGETVGMEHAGELGACIMALGELVDAEYLEVGAAFLMTTRICILGTRFDSLYARPPLPKLKERIQGLFPESGCLNDKGMVTYRRLLPNTSHTDERAFIVRILAGLAKIWAEEDHVNARISLEYLSRKKFSVPKPKWIMPTVLDDNDITWIIWGAITLYAPHNPVVATSFKLFCSNYKKQYKNERAGLLWSVFYHLLCSYTTTDLWWTAEEKKIYNHVSMNVRALWSQIVPPVAPQPSPKSAQWATYFPRGAVCTVTDIPPVKDEPRMLKIKDPKVHETSDINSRDWRIYPCE
jgi:hypothetical protein